MSYGNVQDFRECYATELACVEKSDAEIQKQLDIACAEVNLCIVCCGSTLEASIAYLESINATGMLAKWEHTLARYYMYSKVDTLDTKMQLDYESALAQIEKICSCTKEEQVGVVGGYAFCEEEVCINKSCCIQCGCCGCECDGVNSDVKLYPESHQAA